VVVDERAAEATDGETGEQAKGEEIGVGRRVESQRPTASAMVTGLFFFFSAICSMLPFFGCVTGR
jgi:hypothetical protein